MVSAQARLGLLVMTHVVGGLILAWAARTNAAFAGFGLFAWTFAEAGLVGMWGALSATRFTWRLLLVSGATVYLWSIQVIDVPTDGEYSLALFLVIALTVATIIVVLSGFRHSRRRLRLAHLSKASPASKGFQFAIRHLLLATAIMALVLGIGREVQTFGSDWENTVAVAIFPPCITLVELATLWAALSIERPALRLAAVVATACAVGVIPVFYWGYSSEDAWLFVTWSAIFGSQAIITAASLLMVRSCGWRLVSGGGNTVDKQLLPDDQGSATAGASSTT